MLKTLHSFLNCHEIKLHRLSGLIFFCWAITETRFVTINQITVGFRYIDKLLTRLYNDRFLISRLSLTKLFTRKTYFSILTDNVCRIVLNMKEEDINACLFISKANCNLINCYETCFCNCSTKKYQTRQSV
jgi:hypothetical protein